MYEVCNFRIAKLFSFLFIYLSPIVGTAQVSSTFEKVLIKDTSNQERFVMYLDTLDKYLYRDISIATATIAECEKIIEQDTPLSDSILFNYALQKIYFKFNINDPLGAYRLIADNEMMLEVGNLDAKSIRTFKYLRSFTYMTIGDKEAAQKSFYEEMELAKAKRDTATLVNTNYSLGQLYNDNDEYEESIKCFQQIVDFSKSFEIRPTTMALTYMEMGESYSKDEDYEKALVSFRNAEDIIEEFDLDILKSDLLLYRGNVHLAEKNIKAAELLYEKWKVINSGSLDQNNINNTQKFLANLYRAKSKFPQALSVYKKIIAATDSTNLDDLMESYKNMHEVSSQMQDYESAYDYLREHNRILEKRDEDSKRRKTAYLKIKYDSEQKEIDNKLLASQLSQNRTERKVLYLSLAIFFLLTTLLVGAFIQKRRYSNKLEDQVAKRTEKLKKSNELLNASMEELYEFNRILSHDLKEPLRSIVSFSQLASREASDPVKVNEYLDYVTKSGKQLNQLIEDVRLYIEADKLSNENKALLSIPSLVSDLEYKVKKQWPDKQVKIKCNTDATILFSKEPLSYIIRILIGNGIKYNDHAVVNIKVDYSKEDNFHVFLIEDNGIGIDARYQDQIFDMFNRLNNRVEYTGSGLGLSIAQKLAKKMNGEISVVRSAINEGTVFQIKFTE
jgi:signal transduction histidine kinase